MFENKLFRDWSGLVGPGRVGNSDNRANLAQVQMNLPTRAKLGKTVHRARNILEYYRTSTLGQHHHD